MMMYISFLLWPFLSQAQKSMTFQEAKRIGIFDELDKRYKGGISADSSEAIFTDQTQYTNAYQNFILGLGKHLKEHGFRWDKSVRCFNKVYFSPQGRVDYFLYNFKPGELTEQQELTFSKLLADYIQTAQFGLSAPVRFSQCSPVKYNDV